MTLQQDALDYSNEAQYRVCADTRVLRKRTTLAIVSGTQTYSLPNDVIALLAVLDPEGEPVPFLTLDDALAGLTAPTDLATTAYYMIGTSLGVLPMPTAAVTWTLYYEARPAPLTSASPFELDGDYELLIDRLVQAMKLADDGQPELAAEEQGFYDIDRNRLRRRDAREPRGRVRLAMFDG